MKTKLLLVVILAYALPCLATGIGYLIDELKSKVSTELVDWKQTCSEYDPGIRCANQREKIGQDLATLVWLTNQGGVGFKKEKAWAMHQLDDFGK